MRGFVCGLVVSVCFILGTGRAWHSPLPATPPVVAAQPQNKPADSTAKPPRAQPQAGLQPQMARELLELRRQLGDTWQSGQEGDAAFLEALKQVAKQDIGTKSADALPRNIASPDAKTHDQLFEICQQLLRLTQQLRRNGQIQAANRLDAFETLLRGEMQYWPAFPSRAESVDTTLAPADTPQSAPTR